MPTFHLSLRAKKLDHPLEYLGSEFIAYDLDTLSDIFKNIVNNNHNFIDRYWNKVDSSLKGCIGKDIDCTLL